MKRKKKIKIPKPFWRTAKNENVKMAVVYMFVGDLGMIKID